MRKLGFIITLQVVLWLMGCRSAPQNDSITQADSINALKDINNRPKMTIEKSDAEFLVEANAGGLAEIELGKLAKEKGVSKQVKNFGSMMVVGHAKINDQINALATAKSITIPKTPGAGEQRVISELSKRSGTDFDKAYIKNTIANHKNDVVAFSKASKQAVDPDIKAFAAKTLPKLQARLEAINTIYGNMK